MPWSKGSGAKILKLVSPEHNLNTQTGKTTLWFIRAMITAVFLTTHLIGVHFSSSFPPSFSLILWYHLFFFFFSISFLLFPLIICGLTQQQHNFMPGGAAEETEPFHVHGTAGLIQKKTNFFLARVKPICSCTKFLRTLSWLQRKTEWEWDSVTQNPCQPQNCACCLPGSEQGLCSQLTRPGWGQAQRGQVPPRDVLV